MVFLPHFQVLVRQIARVDNPANPIEIFLRYSPNMAGAQSPLILRPNAVKWIPNQQDHLVELLHIPPRALIEIRFKSTSQ